MDAQPTGLKGTWYRVSSSSGEVKYFNSLDAWAIRPSGPSGEAKDGSDNGEESSGAGSDRDDDLPF